MNGSEEMAFIISVYAVYMFSDVRIDCGKRIPSSLLSRLSFRKKRSWKKEN